MKSMSLAFAALLLTNLEYCTPFLHHHSPHVSLRTSSPNLRNSASTTKTIVTFVQHQHQHQHQCCSKHTHQTQSPFHTQSSSLSLSLSSSSAYRNRNRNIRSSLRLHVPTPSTPTPTSSTSISLSSEQITTQTDNETETDQSESTSEQRSISFNEPGPNKIPPESTTPNLSKLEQEFYSMMREFANFTPKDISSVSSPRYRALYRGVKAGSNEVQVMKAFAIVFSDLMPVRIAGRMIYRHLKSVMDVSTKRQYDMEQKLVDDHGLDVEAIDYGHRAFMAIMHSNDGDGDGDGHGHGDDDVKEEAKLTMSALVDSGIVNTIVELLEFDSFDEFVEKMGADHDDQLTFERFMVGLQKCTGSSGDSGSDSDSDSAEPMPCDVDVTCDLSLVLNEIVERMEPYEAEKKEISISERKLKYSQRYDNMVKSFEEWEDLVPSGDGRMVEVLRGCFAGAKDEDVVGALKIVYMDYSALRVGGNLVFKLMGKLVKRSQKKAA